ncbi:MAG: nitrous oxide-stimulated promoter family protein [Nevskiales bacterium]
MTRRGRDQAGAAPFIRRAREFRTIAVMLRMYCRAHHDPDDAPLCHDCIELHDYARRRLQRCLFGEAKPTCANCTVHCYKAVMRERVRQVMVWAGPRMLWRHPVLAVRHLIAERRPAPILHRPP